MKHYVNHIVQTCRRLPLFIVTVVLVLSCSDSETLENGTTDDLFALSEQSVRLSSKAQYHLLQVEKKADGLSVKIESDAEWLKVCQDSLTEDGWFEVFLYEDDEEIERSARLTIIGTDGNRTQTSVCKIVQGEDNGENGYTADATKTMRVGYGYDIFGSYMNDTSVKESILSQDRLSVITDSMRLVETSSRSVLDMEKNTSRSIVELAELLTKKQETETTNLKGCHNTIKEMSSSKYEANEIQYAYIRYYKTSAMRSLDIGVLYKMIDEGVNVFSNDFKKLREEIIANPNDKNKITSMLTKYGTHLVVKGELGAAIEITATFDNYMTGELSLRAEDFADYFFNGESSSYVLANGKVKDMTSTITIDGNCHIYGGSIVTKEALKKGINTYGRVSQELLKDWLDSSSGNLDDSEIAQALVPINFRLIPIWNLFPIKCVQPIVDVVNTLANNSVNRISESQIGSDYYKLELTDDLLSFGMSANDTQVKVLYAKNTDNSTYSPILEICNEYVPNIRGDKRIPVVYGIKDGRSFIGAGFFPGDGEGNPPAWLTFSDGDCYVKPLQGFDNDKRLTTIYYLNGNIYETDHGMNCNAPKYTKVNDQYLQFSNSHKYPIVKLGSGYWTRCNIKENMMFGTQRKGRFQVHEVLTGNILFAEIFDTNNDRFLDDNYTVYGKDIDAVYSKRIKWYIPVTEDRTNLTAYLGDNLKALFKNQVAGFDAEFVGYYGQYDILTGIVLDGQNRLGVDKYCCLAFKKDLESNEGDALLLTTDYTWNHASIKATNNNYYPIRLFRTNYFTYK